jgi:hypothetical protein
MAVGHATVPAWTRWEVARGPCHPPSTCHLTCSPRPRLVLPRSVAPCLLSDPVTLSSFPCRSPCLWPRCIQCGCNIMRIQLLQSLLLYVASGKLFQLHFPCAATLLLHSGGHGGFPQEASWWLPVIRHSEKKMLRRSLNWLLREDLLHVHHGRRSDQFFPARVESGP